MFRAGFGPRSDEMRELTHASTPKIWRELKKDKDFIPITFETPSVDSELQRISKLDAEQKKKVNKENTAQNYELNLSFLNAMAQSEDQLREKMAFFWHGHFATRVTRSVLNQQMLNILRENALGSFKDLLFAISKAPAMLQFLNNRQNKKGHPNENFAREVMELFTMGRGNYTEDDIREAARAYTGWNFDEDANFVFRKNQHDEGIKTFLGHTGNFTGDDILNIILEQKATPRFITTKIYKFFVNDQPDEEIINHLSSVFYESGYDIKKLMETIFTSSWFYEDKNIGAKIKSPIELMAGMMRILPIQNGNPQNLINYQRLLGQMLLFPPNVAGWPMGKAWIDSSTLLLRMQLPQIWSGLQPLDRRLRSDDDLDGGIRSNPFFTKSTKRAKIVIDWDVVERNLSSQNIADALLQKPLTIAPDQMNLFSDSTVRSWIINIMSTPEYQLC